MLAPSLLPPFREPSWIKEDTFLNPEGDLHCNQEFLSVCYLKDLLKERLRLSAIGAGHDLRVLGIKP